jgi:hypothetical protein
MVCSDQLGLDHAREEIKNDWVSAYKKYVSK